MTIVSIRAVCNGYFTIITESILLFSLIVLEYFYHICYAICRWRCPMITRWQENRLVEMMGTRRGVNLTGARQSGKTTLSEIVRFPKQRRYTLDDKEIRRSAADDPKGFVKHEKGETLVLDEIQKVPDLLDAIKMVLDANNDRGQYLLTGSSNLRFTKAVKDSLAGRLGWLRLRTLSLGEIFGNKTTFLETAFSRKFKREYQEIKKRAAIRLAFCGGYPEPREFSERDRRDWFQTYLEDLLTKDIKDVTEIRKLDVLKKAAVWLLAHSAQFFAIDELAAKVSLAKETVLNYLEALKALYLFDSVPAFSKSDYDLLGKRPKWFATDASLLANILSWNEDEVYLDQSRNGKLIETWVYQQLAAMADVGGTYGISHYRDGKKREIDFVVERDDGNLLGIEVKSGAVGSSDFSNLKWFAANIAKGTPFTGIVVHSGKDVLPFGDGFYAVPFAALAE